MDQYINRQKLCFQITIRGAEQICPRDARPNRCTPDLRRPCEVDARIRGCRSRPCLLCAHRLLADSVQFDRPALSRCVPMGPVLCQERKRDARPNRSTPNIRRPCESDARIRGGCSRPCLLCAHRFSADSVMVDAGRLARPRPYARARSDSGKGKNVNDTYRNDQMRMTSSIEIIKYNSLTSSVGRKQHNVA